MSIKSWKHLDKKGKPFQTEADAKLEGAPPKPPDPEVFSKAKSVSPKASVARCDVIDPE